MIRFGLGAVKGVGEGAVEVIKQARDEGGSLLSLFDFCKRVDGRKVNRKVIEALVKAGAFDGVAAENSVTRARVFGAIGLASERAAEAQRERESGQTNLLALFAPKNGNGSNGSAVADQKYPPADEWLPKELLAYEKEALGFYISGHPLDRYAGEIRRYTNATAANCTEKGERAEVVLAGVVTSYQERPMKNGQGKYAFFTLEDRSGQIEFIVNSRKVEEHRELLSRDEPLLVTGTVDTPFGEGEAARERLRFIDAKPLSRIRAEKSSLLDIKLNADVVSEDQIKALEKVLRAHTGACKAVLRMEIPKRSETVFDLGDGYKVAASDDLLARIEQIFGARVRGAALGHRITVRARSASESIYACWLSFAAVGRPNYDHVLRRETSRPKQKTAEVPTARQLLQDVAEGIRVLQTRDGIELTDAQILERARNIVTGLLGNYRIRSLDVREPPGPRSLHQMDLLEQLEERAEERNNGRSGRA